MITRALSLAGTALILLAGAAAADDHLFQAEEYGGLGSGPAAAHNQASTINPAGHSGDLAPGQGSPFTGDDTSTPATDTEAAQDHANVKDRKPK
jgi:hypothetical protein